MCMSVYWSLCEFVWVQAKTMKLWHLFQETRNKVPRLDQFRSINYGPKLVEPILVTTLIQILFITHSLHSLSSSAGDGGLENVWTKILHVIFGNLPKFRSQNPKLSILTEKLHTWHSRIVDSEFRIGFLKFQPQNQFLGKFEPKNSKLFVFFENWCT